MRIVALDIRSRSVDVRLSNEEADRRVFHNNLLDLVVDLPRSSSSNISPMTIQAIKRCMVKEIPEINKVQANTGQITAAETDTSPSLPGQSSDESSTQDPEIPF